VVVRSLVFLIGFSWATFCRAAVASVPSWLPTECRFEVSGDSNEVRQVEATLAAMRDSLNPNLREVVEKNNYLGPCLQWIVRWSRQGIANEAQYLSKTAHPESFTVADFDMDRLTNTIRRMSYLPYTVKLSLVYDDRTLSPVSRAIPGVDYPGISAEDAGSTNSVVKIVLRAPKKNRRFRILAEASPPCRQEVELKCVVLNGYAAIYGVPNDIRSNGCMRRDMNFSYEHAQKTPVTVAFFARAKGGLWGPPSFVHVRTDELCRHTYDRRGIIESIDYGDYADFYRLDEKDRIMGFTRRQAGMIRGDEYSCTGELIVEAYPNEMPKVAHRVRYYVSDGKLKYEELDADIRYKHGEISVRSQKW